MTVAFKTGRMSVKREPPRESKPLWRGRRERRTIKDTSMEPTLELRIYQWAAGLTLFLIGLGGNLVWGRLNRHGKKLDAQEQAMADYKTAAAVRGEQMTNISGTLVRLEIFLNDHMEREESNTDAIKKDVAEIKLTLAALPTKGVD